MPIPDPKSDNLAALEGIIYTFLLIYRHKKRRVAPPKYHAGVVSAQPTVFGSEVSA